MMMMNIENTLQLSIFIFILNLMFLLINSLFCQKNALAIPILALMNILIFYFNHITLKDRRHSQNENCPFCPLLFSCCTYHVAPRVQYRTLHSLTCVSRHLFIHSPLNSKPIFSHLNSFTHSY